MTADAASLPIDMSVLSILNRSIIVSLLSAISNAALHASKYGSCDSAIYVAIAVTKRLFVN